MSSDVDFISEINAITDHQLAKLADDFLNDFIDNTDYVVDLSMIDIRDIMTVLPQEFWTAKMFTIYGQALAYNHIHEFTDTRLQGSKPLPLGKDVSLDE